MGQFSMKILPDTGSRLDGNQHALPFLIIDLVVSAVLMSMGMMMVPPVVVALPFKLAFFVVVNGWGMIAAALVRSYQ